MWSLQAVPSRPELYSRVSGPDAPEPDFYSRPDVFVQDAPPAPTLPPEMGPLWDPKKFIRSLGHFKSATATANLDLCAASVCTPGYYDTACVTIPPCTHLVASATTAQDSCGQQVTGVSLWLSQPVKITNAVKAVVGPKDGWGIFRPLTNMMTSYRFQGVTMTVGCPPQLHGRVKILGVFGARWLDKKVSDTFSDPTVPTDPRTFKLALQALSNVGQASPCPGVFSLQGSGTMPPEAALDLSTQSFVLLPGGDYTIQAQGAFDLRTANEVSLHAQGLNQQSVFRSTPFGFSLQGDARVGLEERGDDKVHIWGMGSLDLSVHRLQLDVRAKELPKTGGIRISGGEVRVNRPYAPALNVPVQFTYHRGTLNATGLLNVNLGAVFVGPQDPPPAFEDDSLACDVGGTLDLSAIVPRMPGHAPRLHQPNPPDYAVRGVVSVRPPKSDPVYYRMEVTPSGPDFQLEPDYTPPQVPVLADPTAGSV